MLKVQDLKNEIKINDLSQELTGYSDGYICDVISEIADSNTSIMYCDIKDFICNNFDMLEEAINEFGWDGCGSNIYKAGQMAEYLQNERTIYDELSESLLYYAYDYLLNQCTIELTEEQNEKLTDFVNGLDNNDRLDDINDFINDELFENDEESGEE